MMGASRYSTSRQKACHQCSSAKAKCDRKAGRCTRCMQRDLQCTYPRAEASGSPGQQNSTLVSRDGQPPSPSSTSHASFLGSENGLSVMHGNDDNSLIGVQQMIDSQHGDTLRADLANTSSPTIPRPFRSDNQGITTSTHISDRPYGLDILDFSSLDLVCPINADDIKNRWLNAYIPVPAQTDKQYPASVSAFIFRVLKSYAAVAVHGRGILPFIHPKQMMAQPAGSPLTTCLSFVRMCSNLLPGSENAAASVLQREMSSLYDLREEYNDEALFAAFQAYLIYTMVLFFQLNHACDDFFRGLMTNLQELACSSSRQGLVCSADQRRARPRWEEWITAETKRRTLFVMYLFDSILSIQEGLPSFLGTELTGLPAPANGLLWHAQSRYDWEREYNIHLAEWMDGNLTIDELWPMPVDLSEDDIAKRRVRVDRWLENLDEYGTMLYAIMSVTHGG